LGSTYYTDHPSVPLFKTIANINIDGVAAFEEFNDIIGIGSEYSTLKNDLHRIADQLDLTISDIPSEYFYESQNINRSDQFAFMKAGIPSVLLVEGVNYKKSSYAEGIQRMIKWNQMIYHTPFDDLHQPINYLAVNQHARFIYLFIHHLANKASAPTWNKGVPFINARLQSIAEKR
jgi:Zn-dependent M28 family amino/carboxypeptidase